MNDDLVRKCSNAVYGTMAINTVVQIYQFDLIDAIEERDDLYRYGLKRAVKVLEKDYKDNHAILMERLVHISSMRLVEDFGRAISDAIKPDIERLRIAVSNEIGKYTKTDIQLKAMAMTLVGLADVAVGTVNEGIKRVGKGRIYIDNEHYLSPISALAPLRLDSTLKHAQNVANILCKDESKVVIDLNKSESCVLGLKVVINRLQDGQLLMDALEKAHINTK